MSYCFRVRFRVGSRVRIQSDAQELVLADGDGERVIVRSTQENEQLSDAEQMAVRGESYGSEAEARRAGERWVSRLQVAFARLRCGADFGARGPRSMVTEYGLRWLEQMAGQRVVADAPGVLVFECEPPPRFASIGATAVVGKPAERFIRLVRAAAERDLVLDEREQLAFDLYSASFSETSADARFLLLMMALETLIDQEERPQDVQEHVSRLIADTKASELSADQVDSLVGSLEWLRVESVGRAGRGLASSLGEREYMDEAPDRFFMRCYEMRSQLVHGHYPRPDFGEVGTRAANLEGFVGDLLASALLDVED